MSAPTEAELEAARKRLRPYIRGYPQPMIDSRRLRIANGTANEQERREIAAEDVVWRELAGVAELSTERFDRALEALGPVELTERAAEDRAVRFLLDGLEVESIRELKRLVDSGRTHEELMEPIRAQLREAGVPEDLLP